MYFQCLAVPFVLFYVVESTCNPLTVTAAVKLPHDESVKTIFHIFPIAFYYVFDKYRAGGEYSTFSI
jgi:hypothetical protein